MPSWEGFWTVLHTAVAGLTDWAVHSVDRRALLDAVLSELESNLVALDQIIETDEAQWQKAATSRWVDPELRRVLTRTYRLLGEYNRRLTRWHNPPPPDPNVIQAIGSSNMWRRDHAVKAADEARPWVRYAASCVSARNAKKPLPSRPSDLVP